MNAVLASKVARRRAILFVALLATSLMFMAISSNRLVIELQNGIGFAFRPVMSSIDGVGRDLSSIVGAIAEIDQLRQDNEALRAELERLRNENRQAAELRRENELLTGLLQLRNGFEYETVAAAVIARESSEVQRRVVLDRGTSAGIAIGDVVVAGGGALVGRVIEAGSTSSIVQLISDPGSTVIGQLVGSAATGEVTGQLPGTLLMENIDSTVTVNLGEEVVTAGIDLGSGLRSPYPKGLVIGQVIDVRRDANEIVQTAFLEPAALLDRLEFLLVILDYEGGLPPAEEQPTPCEPGEGGVIPDGEQPCIEATPTPAPSTSAAR